MKKKMFLIVTSLVGLFGTNAFATFEPGTFYNNPYAGGYSEIGCVQTRDYCGMLWQGATGWFF